MSKQDCCFNISDGVKKACWVLSNQCNMSCEYCAASAISLINEMPPPISMTACDRVIKQCRETGIERVILSGGEPLLIPNLPEVIGCLTGRDIRTSVSTNGTLLTDSQIRPLLLADISKAVIGVNVTKMWQGSNYEPTAYLSEITRNLQSVQNSKLEFEITFVMLLFFKQALLKIAEWIAPFRPTSISLIVPQQCGKMVVDSREDCGQTVHSLAETAQLFQTFVNPLKVSFVSPRCRYNDCPSNQLVFGVNAQGQFGHCPWKKHFGLMEEEEIAEPELTLGIIS